MHAFAALPPFVLPKLPDMPLPLKPICDSPGRGLAVRAEADQPPHPEGWAHLRCDGVVPPVHPARLRHLPGGRHRGALWRALLFTTVMVVVRRLKSVVVIAEERMFGDRRRAKRDSNKDGRQEQTELYG